jgi:hypothetical protein
MGIWDSGAVSLTGKEQRGMPRRRRAERGFEACLRCIEIEQAPPNGHYFLPDRVSIPNIPWSG